LVDKTPAELDPGTSSDTSVVHASENDVITNSKKHTERDISRLQGTAPLYSSSKTYNVNDLVTESGIVFRCINSIAVPELFNNANWAEINAEDVLIFVRNISGSMIPKGSAVYISGEDSGIATVELAIASEVSTVPSIGLAQSNISNNNNGEVVNVGKITDLDTSSFLAGDLLFLSATVPGAITTTAPTHPNLRQSLGVVLVSDISIGEVEVITGDVSGAESGTIFNTFAIGDGLTGTKTLSFLNNLGTFSANALFTESRTQTFQDADGTIALLSDVNNITASNVGTGAGVFKQKVLADLEFRSILGADDFVISELLNEVEISAPNLRRRFTSKRQMTMHFGTGEIISNDGMGAEIVVIEGQQAAFLDADGYYVNQLSETGMMIEPGGYIVVDSVRRDLNFDVTIKFRLNTLTNTGFFLGFFDNDPTTVSLPTIEHFALILQTDNADVNFRISHSDGVTQGETQVALQDTLIHTVRLVSDETNSRFLYSFDGAALTAIGVNIPAATTNLDLYLESDDLLDGGLANWDFWYLDGFCDK